MQRMLSMTALLGLLAVLALAAPAPAQEAQIAIKVNQPGVKISPTLYGIFFEEINRAGDGGLYAEMLENRSFEDNANAVNSSPGSGNARTIIVAGQVYAWSLTGSGKMLLDTRKPLNPNNPTSLRLEVHGEATLSNAGFKGVGLNIADGATYLLSLYTRAAEGSLALEARLVAKDGKVLASQDVSGIGSDWKKTELALTAKGGDPAARLELAAKGDGILFLDMVSLFPKDTFKGRRNGMRKDLAQMVAAMHPAFMRFPGGCFVEGESMKIAFRWKKTIGDIAERPGHWDLWGYMSNDGLGYHEYLQFCEDIGAKPLYVVNVGMAHKDAIAMDKMDEMVQDALDAVEYANGPVDSKWGALRAKAGHPAPFNLKYMEIGNENGGPKYLERYPLFVKALRAKYPALHLITNNWGGNISLYKDAEIIDEHDYSTPEHFLAASNKYDTYDRKGAKIYMGEYAVTHGYGTTGNLIAALGEAAYMTGMERNSDVVTMASYAPLFVNTAFRQWSPDAIVFDPARAFGTPSYHVQAMFSSNRPDVNLPVEVTLPKTAAAPAAPKILAGRYGVGTYGTQAEFKDIEVTAGGKTVFKGDAAALKAPGAGTLGGQWVVQGNTLRQAGAGSPARRYFGDLSAADYTIALKARKTSGGEGFLICFSTPAGSEEHNWWNIGGWQNTSTAIELNGSTLDQKGIVVEMGKWYDVKLEVRGLRVRCWLDGKLQHDVTAAPPEFKTLFAVAGLKGSRNEVNFKTRDANGQIKELEKEDALILKVVNAADQPQAATIDLAGAGKLEPTAKALVLTSASPKDENTMENPSKIVPKETTVEGIAANFKHTFPANSVTILTLWQSKK